jgi:hypothetical protein
MGVASGSYQRGTFEIKRREKKDDAPCLGLYDQVEASALEIKVAIIPIALIAFICARWSTTARGIE